MSLFKLKNLWAKSHPQEEFDEKHLAVTAAWNGLAITLGSFSGKVRTYLIKVHDKVVNCVPVFEKDFQMPVIDVKFVQHPNERIKHETIAVLVFKKIHFVSFEQKGGEFIPSSLFSIEVEPSFGIMARPLAVCTLNSQLLLLSPRHSMPLKVTDPIYPFTSDHTRFLFGHGQELVCVEGSVEQWRVLVGPFRFIKCVREQIVLIGERALWEVENRTITKTKILESEVSFGRVIIKSNLDYNILVGTFQLQLLIYTANYSLLWAARIEAIPLYIHISTLQGLNGAMVILTEEGTVQLSYLSTESSQSVLSPLSDDIDTATLDTEIGSLMAAVRRLTEVPTNTDALQKPLQTIKMTAKFSEPLPFTEYMDQTSNLYTSNGTPLCSRLACHIQASKQVLLNVNVAVELPDNLYCLQSQKYIPKIDKNHTVEFCVFAIKNRFPTATKVGITISFSTAGRGPLSIQAIETTIPESLQSKVIGFEASTKKNLSKILLKCTPDMIPITSLIPKLMANCPGEATAVVLEYPNKHSCCLAVSKKGDKFKVESEQYQALCYGFQLFSQALAHHNATNPTRQIAVSFEPSLEQFFAVINEHTKARRVKEQARVSLERRCEQFRSVQKKFMLKVKDNVSSMGHMEKLLEYAYGQVLQTARSLEQKNEICGQVSHRLSASVNLTLQMLYVRCGASERARQICNGILRYESEGDSYGWEEKVVATAGYYLNKKSTGETVTAEQVQKVLMWLFSKLLNSSGQWTD